MVLARRRGNGPPWHRCLAGVRARPAPLALGHWPDSYGRLQSRIFGNGRKPDRATPRARRRPSGCKALSGGRKAARPDRPPEEARAKFVPAAAVRRTVRTLFGIIGLKGRVDGRPRRVLKSPGSTGERASKRVVSSEGGGPGTSGGAVKCVDIGGNASGESGGLDPS